MVEYFSYGARVANNEFRHGEFTRHACYGVEGSTS